MIVSALPDLPRSFEALGARLDNAALLAKAGVKIAHVAARAHATTSAAPCASRRATPWPTACPGRRRWPRSPAHPAEIFDVAAARSARWPPARSADLVVWSGDPFEPLTRPRHVFIAGREIPLRSRQTELRDRYRKLAGIRPAP